MGRIKAYTQYISKIVNLDYPSRRAPYFSIPKELQAQYDFAIGQIIYQWTQDGYTFLSKEKPKNKSYVETKMNAARRVRFLRQSVSQEKMMSMDGGAYIRFYDLEPSANDDLNITTPILGYKLLWLRDNCVFCHSESNLINFNGNCICGHCLKQLLQTFKDML